jgi:hypothetical protein
LSKACCKLEHWTASEQIRPRRFLSTGLYIIAGGIFAFVSVLLFANSGLRISPELISSVLLCAFCVAMILGPKGMHLSFGSPLAVVPAIHLVSLGLPSLGYALGVYSTNEFFLRPEFVTVVNWYALAALVLFYLGFSAADWRMDKRKTRNGENSPRVFKRSTRVPTRPRETEIVGQSGKMYANLVCVLAVGAFACFYFSFMSQGMLASDVIRGTGQFDTWGLDNYLVMLGEAGLLLSTLTAGAIRVWSPRRRLWMVPLLTSIEMAVTGSRGTVLPFLLFLLASAIADRKLSKRSLAILAPLALFCLLSATFIVQVRPSRYGVTNFFRAMQEGIGHVEAINPISGVSSFEITTAVFWIAQHATPRNAIAQVWRLLVPLPSFIVSQDIMLTNVMPYLGIYGGNHGTPFPVLGELFFFLGWLGVFCGFAAGFASCWLFRRCELALDRKRCANFLWPLVYTACVFGAVMSMHQGVRTLTRYPIWAVLWYFGVTRLAILMRVKSLATATGVPDPRRA